MKKNIVFWIIVTILIANLFFVYFGRIYFPKNFSPETVSFLENYLIVIAGLIITILIIAFMLLCIVVIVLLSFDILDSIFSFFSSIVNLFHRKETKTKVDWESEIQKGKMEFEKQQERADFDRMVNEKQLHYKTKFSKEITDHILLETFDDEIEFYKAVQSTDCYIAKSKEGIILQLNERRNCFISVGVTVCILKGITIEKKKDEIIKEIEQLEDFKGIRISYIRTELTSYDIDKFERYKREGFPNY